MTIGEKSTELFMQSINATPKSSEDAVQSHLYLFTISSISEKKKLFSQRHPLRPLKIYTKKTL